MTDQELLGTLVLVHPNLEDHPAGREGHIGFITYVDRPENEVYVRFTDEAEAVYPTDAIFLLKDREKIFCPDKAQTNAATLNDYKDLFKIAMLQDKGRSTDIWNALQIARDNPGIWPATLISAEESLGLRSNRYVGR
ncbi:hypothetical protein D0C36_19205 [Mucilaginibacter conchicola]|uniref:Uncharacterized protein n=1 Tax=Mucilaginibacter conchicola TaxID=2303333 RepID=A0A372NQ72_9SPHI|nr:hypothetical protein [Mucilaginibacter conchicola]RFZ91072.1 hypothetical protein D0C36_19205 [Mucilaginibacter conchicola]